MIKLAIGLCVLFVSYLEPLDIRSSSLSFYSEGLKAASNNFKSEVKFVINEAHMVESEYKKLLETLHDSATSLHKEVSDRVNYTITRFNKDVNNLLADASIDVSECMTLRSTIESTMTDILINSNTCVHDKLIKAQVYIDKSILSIEYILERLKSLANLADDSFSKPMKNNNIKPVFRTKTDFESFFTQPNNVAAKLLSTLTDTTLVISRINSLMISDCVSNQALSSLVEETQFIYSRIKACIADLNPSDADL